MIVINTFSLIDLVAVIISTHVLLVFFHRSVRVTKRRIDLLFTAVMFIVWGEALFVLASDNVVPAGVSAESVPNAAARTLLWYRLMYAAGTLLMATLTHFALRYAHSRQLSGWRVAWLYAGALALVPLYFTDAFLIARTSPLQPTSGWLCAAPWQPDSGPGGAVFIILWLAVNVYIHWLLWHRPRPAVRGNFFEQRNFVWCGVTLWGVGGLNSMVLAACGYAGVDPTMFLIAAAMVVLAIGLAEDHRRTEVRNGFIKQVFGRYVTDDVVEKLLEDPRGLELGGEKRVVSVMMSDLRAFTAIAERLSPEQVVELLNVYLGAMSEVIAQHQGTINEFIGDGILAVFGAPIRREDATESAVRCALAMQLEMSRVNPQLAGLGIPPLEMGIGINTGEVVIGNIGSAKRAKYGVVGSNVNLAARIESATVGGQVLVSQSTVAALPGLLELRRQMTLRPKGAKEPVVVFEIGGIAGARPLRLPEEDEIWEQPGEPLLLECTRVSDNKLVIGLPFEARVVARSMTGVQLEQAHGLEVGTNLTMRVIGRVDFATTPDLYGKVVSVGSASGGCVVRFTSLPPGAWHTGGFVPANSKSGDRILEPQS